MTKPLKISLWNFLWNLLKFSSVSFSDCFPGVFCFYIFTLAGSEELIGVAGIIRSLYILFLGWCSNFFEPINTLCLPFLTKKNFKLYSLKVWRLGVFNIIFWFMFSCLFLIFKRILLRFTLSQDLIASLDAAPEFFLLVGLSSIMGGFLRGISD